MKFAKVLLVSGLLIASFGCSSPILYGPKKIVHGVGWMFKNKKPKPAPKPAPKKTTKSAPKK